MLVYSKKPKGISTSFMDSDFHHIHNGGLNILKSLILKVYIIFLFKTTLVSIVFICHSHNNFLETDQQTKVRELENSLSTQRHNC